MTRYQQPRQPDPDAWLLTLVDDTDEDGQPAYNANRDPLSDQYSSTWRVDYRVVSARELAEYPNRVTRIDLIQTGYGPAKRTWLAGWFPGDKPSGYSELAAGWTIERAADHLEAEGWKVRRWDGGARAWRVDVRPVRLGRQLEYAKELFRKQGRRNLDNQALLLDY